MIYAHYNKTTHEFAGFYDSEFVSVIPSPAIQLDAAQYSALYRALNDDTPLKINGVTIKPIKHPKPTPPPQTWDSIRVTRDQLLAGTDYTQMPDFPGDKAAWVKYRQALRDIPQTFTDPGKVIWPTKP